MAHVAGCSIGDRGALALSATLSTATALRTFMFGGAQVVCVCVCVFVCSCVTVRRMRYLANAVSAPALSKLLDALVIVEILRIEGARPHGRAPVFGARCVMGCADGPVKGDDGCRAVGAWLMVQHPLKNLDLSCQCARTTRPSCTAPHS